MDTTASPFPTRDELTRLLPQYRLVRLLSQTGMSEVYLAEDTALHDRRVALKVLLPHLAAVDGFRERFVREVRVVSNLQHPNVINIFDATKPGQDLLYLVMPYIDGPNLRTLLETTRGGLDVDRTIRITEQIASALDHAHDRGVVHRDVKPSNILLAGQSEHAYLCDFGIAKESTGERLTMTGQAVGTPGYMAPERYPVIDADETATGQTVPIGPARAEPPTDRSVDVYSLGAVVYECLTGRPPFNFADVRALEYAQRHQDPAPVSELRSGLPKAVDAVLRKAMSRDPNQRYASCAELVEAVRLAVRQRPRRWRPGRGVLITAAAAAVVVVAAIIVVPRLSSQTPGDTPSDDQFGRVPAALRAQCRVADRATGSPGAAAVLACVDGDQSVRIDLFDQQSTMDTAYADTASRAGIARGSGDCPAAVPGEHRFPSTGKATGRVACYSRDGATSIMWIDDAARTLASTSRRDDADIPDLARSWARWVGLPDFPTEAEASLTKLVERTNCRRSPAGGLDSFRTLLAAIECDAPGAGANRISYYRFADLDGLTQTYNGLAGVAGAPPDVLCTDGTAPGFLGNDELDLRSVEVGRLLCFRGPRDAPVLMWTVESLLIMSRLDGTDPKTLTALWRGYFGNGAPTPEIVKAVNATAKPPFPNAQEQALLGHIPEKSRVDCMRPPPTQVAKNVRDSTVTAVVCGPTRGAPIVFYYQFYDTVAMNADYGPNADVSGPDCTTEPPDFHGDRPYSRNGSTGRLGCWKDADGAHLVWTDDRLQILSFAFYGDAKKPTGLIDWWRFDAGPV